MRHDLLFAPHVTILQLSPIDNRLPVRYSGTKIGFPWSSTVANLVKGKNRMTTTMSSLPQVIQAFFIGLRLLGDLLDPQRSPISVCVAADQASLDR